MDVLLSLKREDLIAEFEDLAVKTYEEKVSSFGNELTDQIERYIFLRTIDSNWKDHLYTMDDLKEGIGLRAYGGRDPLIEYQKEGHEFFDNMIERIKEDTIRTLFKIELKQDDEVSNQKSEMSVSHTMNNENSKLGKEERQKRRSLKKKLKKKRKR